VISFSENEIIELLRLEGEEQKALHAKAAEVRNRSVSDKIYFRGLIEFSNICSNDCLYCGIRRSNTDINRYEMSINAIMGCVDRVSASGISSVVLQSGERNSSSFIDCVLGIIREIKKKYPAMVITLCVGEQERHVYKSFFASGADRYLLRIETSDEDHYRQLHPGNMSFKKRVRCLTDLRDAGFQVGSGVMAASPYQTLKHLAGDILFLNEIDIDMCGMGPYIPHSSSPLPHGYYSSERALNLGLNMISVLRILMPDINIAATTALETLSPVGRELGLMAGANVVMPQFSPPETGKEYMLYNNKPCGHDNCFDLVDCLIRMGEVCGMKPALNEPGNAMHYQRRTRNVSTG